MEASGTSPALAARAARAAGTLRALRPASRDAWLSITPEPERELPPAVAVLSAGHRVGEDAVSRERLRVAAIVLQRGPRRWLGYLREVLELIELRAGDRDPDVMRARTRARVVLANHHNLLLGLPGEGAVLTTDDRARLAALDNPEETRP